MDIGEWVSWEDRQPQEIGEYWWRLRSIEIPDIVLNFVAFAYECNGNIVPSFSTWDGYRSRIPPCEWQPAPKNILYDRSARLLRVEGLAFQQCPFCGDIPRLKGQRCHQGGVFPTAGPQHFNTWNLYCCDWGRTPRSNDPRELERIRREAFARAAAMFAITHAVKVIQGEGNTYGGSKDCI